MVSPLPSPPRHTTCGGSEANMTFADSHDKFAYMLWKILVAVLGASAIPGLAQQTGDPIVVEGQKAGVLKTLRQVRALSRDVDGNLSRFESPVCPGVVGLPISLAATVIDRMRANVKAVGAELAPENCSANLTVIVTENGNDLVNGLFEKSPQLFGYQSKTEMDALRKSKGPAWVWQTTQPKRADGMPVPMLEQVTPGGAQAKRRAYAVPNAKMSRLASTVRQDTGLAFVVLSRTAIEGKTLVQIADYGVLRGLAGTTANAEDAAGSQSIAALFTQTSPAEMTDFDLAYLTGLYGGTNGLTYDQKTREIALGVADALGR